MASFTPAQNNYRLYNDDGSETTSTPIGAEKIYIYQSLDSGDKNTHLRILIQETAGKAGATTDDWQLQFSKNGSAFANVTTSTSGVKAFDSANLTDAGVTTDRGTNGITIGSGSFVAGEIAETGLVTDRQLTASNYTHMLYTLTFIAADNVNGDIFTFRVLINGSTMTYNTTPQVIVTKDTRQTLNNYQFPDASTANTGIMSITEKIK